MTGTKVIKEAAARHLGGGPTTPSRYPQTHEETRRRLARLMNTASDSLLRTEYGYLLRRMGDKWPVEVTLQLMDGRVEILCIEPLPNASTVSPLQPIEVLAAFAAEFQKRNIEPPEIEA